MPETPEERAARWPLYEEYYGPILQPPNDEVLDGEAWQRFVALFRHVPADSWRPQGMGQG
jgi:hypothetical protein